MIDMASEEARRRGGVQVIALHLKLGPLSGVVRKALLFSYQVACQNTPLEGSQLIIEDVQVTVYCPSCEAEKPLASINDSAAPAVEL